MYPLIIKRIKIMFPRGLNKVFGSNFQLDFRVWHETPEEERRTHRLKSCEYEAEDKSPNTLNNKTYRSSSQKFTQIA